MSHACPFCKSALPIPAGAAACSTCGRSTPAGPAGGADTSWDDLDGGLDFSRGGAETHAKGPSAYSGGGLSLGDDDDPFAEDMPAGALELDLPSSHSASSAGAASSRSIPAAPAPPPDREIEPPVSGHLAPRVSQAPRSAPSSSAVKAAPPATSLGPRSPAQRSAEGPTLSSQARPPDPALLIACYPAAPEKIWHAPAYAMKVLWRQLELRQDLASLRKRRSPDVALYERALTVHDAKTFTVGLVISLAGLAVATFVFFLPVLLRFLRDPE